MATEAQGPPPTPLAVVRRWRRPSRPVVAIATSLGIHAAVVAAALGPGLLGSLNALRQPVDIELVTVPTEAPKALPLGPPPSPATAGAPPRPRRARARSTGPLGLAGTDAGVDERAQHGLDAGAADAGVGNADGGARPDPRDLRAYGPQGSRLTALIRLDRLRAGPDAAGFAAVTDELLRLLPDRRTLLDGSGIDIYRDFDALLIATPNPRDVAVTFLVVRHHLGEDALMRGLSQAAAQAGRPLTWRSQAGRPWAVRAPRPELGRPERDDRLIVLPAPGLAVLTSPAYKALLLPETRDAGPGGARSGFAGLIERIDAETGLMPDNGVLLLTAAGLFGSRRAAADLDEPAPGATGGGFAALENLPPPELVTLLAGTTPSPFLNLRAELATPRSARQWETALPEVKTAALANPLVLLGGFSALVARTEIEREGRTVVVTARATPDEAQRLLRLLTNLTRAQLR